MNEYYIPRRMGDLSILDIGCDQCTPGHFFATAFSDRFLIHYVLEGKGIFRSNWQEYSLEAGNAFLISDVYGYYEADEKEPWRYVWINISGEAASYLLSKLGLSSDKPIYQTTDRERIERCYEEICLNYNKVDDFLTYSRIFKLFEALWETNANRERKRRSISESGAERYVKMCCDFIHTNYYKNINIKDVCRFVGLEYSYLFRLFQEQVNLSPGRYLAHYRLTKAAALLRNTAMPVTEIAAAVGYEDRAAFSKAFSNKYGVSPKVYRKA